MTALARYFSSAGFVPHGYCILWRPDILALHVISDSIIAASYFSIPLAILAFLRRRTDLLAEHRRIAVLFGVFILGCGLTHVFGVVVLWQPLYVIDGWIKALTALVSIATAIALWPMLPRLLAIPSPGQLSRANAELQAESVARAQAMDDLRAAHAGLEAEVQRRTEEIEALARRFQIATAGSVMTIAEQDADLRYTWLHNPRPPLSAQALGRTDAQALEPEAAAALAGPKQRVLSTGEPVSAEVVLPVGGEDYSFEVKITPARVGGAHGLLIAAADISEQKRQQAHLQVLLRELAHRAKNILSLVDGIARQSARAESLPETFTQRFTARLAALGGAYDLLIGEDWRGVSLHALAQTQLAFILPDAPGRVTIDGPEVIVRPEIGQYLALALHELATNAAKYGALKGADGEVALSWRRSDGDGVELAWVETGGAATGPPTRSGFGRTLLERVVPRALGADARIEFEPQGVKWRIAFSP
jgi:two-component sensor histidine kinase